MERSGRKVDDTAIEEGQLYLRIYATFKHTTDYAHTTARTNNGCDLHDGLYFRRIRGLFHVNL